MASIDLETITAPISEEQPCGPDLDMEFDMDFMNFVAEIDGTIPTRFFGFDPATLDFQRYYDQIGDFLERTRDIRVLVPLAKLKILQSDIAGFAGVLDATARLLQERWSDLHPQPADFLELGMGQLSTLDDMPNVVLPLQHATLARSRRAGPITLRRWQIAQGEVNPREGEEKIDSATLSAALAETDPDELRNVRALLEKARDSVAAIRTTCIREAGFDHAPQFERLPPAIEAAIGMLDSAIGDAPTAGDPDQAGAAAGGETGAGTVMVRLPAGAVASREEAIEAMHVAARYFALNEPSSPVPVLLREAQSASGKSFYELINDLVPDAAGSAFVSLGADPWFNVYISTLDSRNPPPDYAGEEENAIAEDSGLNDEVEGDPETTADGDGDADFESAAGTEETTAGESTEAGPDEFPAEGGDNAEADEGVADEPSANRDDGAEQALAPGGPPRPKLTAASRPEAVAILEKVLAYYRAAEPSSPVPLLVERAIELSSKNFIELLGKVLPEGSLYERPKDT